jgi:hypothetical protein
MYKEPVRTSQETHYASTTKPNRLMLFGETVAVYCENHTEHTDTLYGRVKVTLRPTISVSKSWFRGPSGSHERISISV